MLNNKNIFDFYQSSGIYDRVIFKNKMSNNRLTLEKLIEKTLSFKNIYNKLGPVNLAAIPIGAYEPRWFMKFSHMNPEEAVMAFQDLKAQQAIGMHWGTFILTDEKVTEPPEKLKIALSEKEIDSSKFITLKHGQTFILD